jgi:LDH2 family malate/lactate/ureidoglycolate dehydrogenase
MANTQTNREGSDGVFKAQELIRFATDLLQKAGLARKRAGVMAEILVEGDLMGHTTHGIQLLSPYLKELDAGSMTKEGEPEVVKDQGAAVLWDGRYLPGPWLVVEAMNLAFERVREHPVVMFVIRRSHHIGCLAAYPKRATDRGLLMLLTCSDPSFKTVAPYGGIVPLYTPNPLAVGIPTRADPIIIDISMSCTTNGLVMRTQKEGKRLPHPWLMDSRGSVTDDPAALFADPPGSILPLGGTDLGYKGFALGLLVEALTAALGGHGRSDEPNNWGASIFLQIIDPQAFGGRDYFVGETQWLAELCRKNPRRPGDPPVRVPGSRALKMRAEQMQRGIRLYPTILPGLKRWSEKLGVPLPGTLS